MNWIGSLLSLLGNLVGWGRDRSARKNTPEIVANKNAAIDAKARDRIAEIESKAAAGDPAAMEELRKLISEE